MPACFTLRACGGDALPRAFSDDPLLGIQGEPSRLFCGDLRRQYDSRESAATDREQREVHGRAADLFYQWHCGWQRGAGHDRREWTVYSAGGCSSAEYADDYELRAEQRKLSAGDLAAGG